MNSLIIVAAYFFRLCTTRCVSYTSCDGPQECCGGGSSYYSLSVVGDIDVAKEVLERLRSKWLGVKEYRDHVMKKINVGFPGSYKRTDWVHSFDNIGWSTCEKNSHGNYLYMVWNVMKGRVVFNFWNMSTAERMQLGVQTRKNATTPTGGVCTHKWVLTLRSENYYSLSSTQKRFQKASFSSCYF